MDEEMPLGADMNEDIRNAILLAHQKMTQLVEDVQIFFSEATATGFFVDEGLVGGIIFVVLFVAVIETLWWRKRRRGKSGLSHQVGCHQEEENAKTTSVDDSNSRSRRRRVAEEASDLEEIRSSLQNELNQSVERRVEGVRASINSRKEEMQQKLAAAEAAMEQELEVVRAKHAAEEKEVRKRCKEKVEALEEECSLEVDQMKESIRELKVILSTSEMEEDVMEQTRSELECPVCLEEMRPPVRIWQCSDGHPVCELCRRKPEVSCCPTCRKYIVGRSTIAEKLARVIYCVEENEG